jgi:hypothetical protein
MLHDDCLGRTLDWLTKYDPTALFAGIARQARQRYGIAARQVHVDTTSFSVSGAYLYSSRLRGDVLTAPNITSRRGVHYEHELGRRSTTWQEPGSDSPHSVGSIR